MVLMISRWGCEFRERVTWTTGGWAEAEGLVGQAGNHEAPAPGRWPILFFADKWIVVYLELVPDPAGLCWA